MVEWTRGFGKSRPEGGWSLNSMDVDRRHEAEKFFLRYASSIEFVRDGKGKFIMVWVEVESNTERKGPPADSPEAAMMAAYDKIDVPGGVKLPPPPKPKPKQPGRR